MMDLLIIYVFGVVIVLVASQDNIATIEKTNSTEGILIPIEPFNVTTVQFSSNTIELIWDIGGDDVSKPIEGFHIYLHGPNQTQNITVKYAEPYTNTYKYTLTDLMPNTEYIVWVKTYNNHFESNPSNVIVQTTDIAGPSAPPIVNFTCRRNSVMFLEWKRPELYFGNIEYYYILIFIDTDLYDNITIPTSHKFLQTSYVIPNVTTNRIYTVEISGSSLSDYSGKLVYGNISSQNIHMQPDCEAIEIEDYGSDKLTTQIVLLTLIVILLLILITLVIWSYKRYCYPPSIFVSSVPCVVPTTDLEWNKFPEPVPLPTETENGKGNTLEEDTEYVGPIEIGMYGNHVARLHIDGDIGFSKEFDEIQETQEEHTSIHSLINENRPKNRYLNITAYDHNRVVLLNLPRRRRNYDYINANYLDGFQVLRAFIGTQGPLPNTYEDFWRMVWEQRVLVIVMITNLIEKGRRKCDMYWPEENSAMYGCMKVTLVKEDVMATFTVRIFKLAHCKIKTRNFSNKEKLVYHYHYTNWPDHGTPDHPLPLLHFVKKTSALNSQNCGPMVVHCSAGVGRTGTYILLDAMLKQIHYRNEVNVFGFLRHLRAQRNFLVQTEEQYVFIHDTLLEAILSGETNISRENYPLYVDALVNKTTNEHDKNWRSLETQYRLVTSFQPKEFLITYPHKEINKPKNRIGGILPLDDSRVHLQPKAGLEGSDYINGTWMQGFEYQREFIVTQHPMRNTINDFWKMIWDHSAHIIVMISIIDCEEFEVFWPPECDTVTSLSFKIELKSEHRISQFIVREYKMQSFTDGYEHTVHMINFYNWPHCCSSAFKMWELVNTVGAMQQECKSGGPIVVVDKYGGTEASIFSCLLSVKKQLLYENHADLYMFAKLFHNKRQGVWPCQETYLTMLKALQAYCKEPQAVRQSKSRTIFGTCLLGECSNVVPEANGIYSVSYEIQNSEVIHMNNCAPKITQVLATVEI